MTIIRYNAIGQKYTISSYDEDSVKIEHEKDSIIVNVSLDEVNQQWYNWIQKGEYIQKAFHNFSADEREFLMTGLTKEQWNDMFKDEKEED